MQPAHRTLSWRSVVEDMFAACFFSLFVLVSDFCVNFSGGFFKSGRSVLKSFTARTLHHAAPRGLVPSAFNSSVPDGSDGHFIVDRMLIFIAKEK